MMVEKNIRIDIEYEGTAYSGWQIQENAMTVQERVQNAVKSVTGIDVNMIPAGRTDAGVHALGQVANFWIDHYLEPAKYKDALNYYLPDDILIKQSCEVGGNFHARKSAIWRHYRYIIGKRRSALYRNLRWEYPFGLDISRLKKAAGEISGVHDFKAFCVVSSQKENNECDIMKADWFENEEEIILDIRANRFLHTMVRSLVGLMSDTAKEKDYLTLDQFRDIFQSGDHTRIKTVAPARGLYLVEAGY